LDWAGTVGRTRKNNQLFVNAVVWRIRTGVPWRDLPERFDHLNSIARRFHRWPLAGVWQTIFQAVQEPDWKWVLLESTTIKAHAAAAGQKSQAPVEYLGRSQSGFHTKLSGVIDTLGNCVHPDLMPSAQANCLLVPDLLAALPQKPGNMVVGETHDTDTVLASITAH